MWFHFFMTQSLYRIMHNTGLWLYFSTLKTFLILECGGNRCCPRMWQYQIFLNLRAWWKCCMYVCMYVCIDGLICSRQVMGVHTFLNPNVALNMVLRLASYWIHYTLKWQIHGAIGNIWCSVLLLQKASIVRLLKKCRNLSPVLKKV